MAEPDPLLFISIYMPFFDSSKPNECVSESIDAISMLEEIISDHPLHRVVVGGDLNTELKGDSPFDVLWLEFMAKNDIVCCDSFNEGTNDYTYIHDSLNQRKWNDHFLVSSSIVASTANHAILDAGDNTSDHLPILFQLSCKMSAQPSCVKPQSKRPSLKWEKCSEQQKQLYTNHLAFISAQRPSEITHCQLAHCTSSNCIRSIQAEYDTLVDIVTEADKVLPRHHPGVQKHWWNDHLTTLRNQNISIHRDWRDAGKPHDGSTNHERLRIRAAYRHALKTAKKHPIQSSWNRLHSNFAAKNTTDFWRSWKQLYNKNQSDLHIVVNGVTAKEDIAESFKSHFVKISRPNSQERVDEIKNEFNELYTKEVANHTNCSCASHRVTVENVIDAVFSLKKDKCCDDASVSAEHFFYAPIPVLQRITALSNAMLLHGHVPRQFQRGTIVPIVKDQHGDKGDMNNYRGITIEPIISKIFEHVLRIIFQPYLTTSSYQFGFKRKSSTSHAIYCLKETINHYTTNGSNVYCSFLDASKAFDRLVHAGLFLKLLQRRVPLTFLNVIIMWYSNLECRVRWGDSTSSWFTIEAGVRQGGVLSPVFYCLYVDDLVDILVALGIGCYLLKTFLSILLFADDMALLAPSLKGLQTLLNATESYCKQWDILLNAKKTKNMYFGKRFILPQLVLDGKQIDWVESWTYLGVHLRSHKNFNCSIDEKVKAFYRCANAILRIDGRSDEMVMLHLLETHCVSVLTYAIEVIDVADRDERRRLRVAYNSVFRRVFGYRNWESVTNLQHALKRSTWEELTEKRMTKFQKSVSEHSLFAR